MKKAVIYIRVSTDDQSTSIDVQKERCLSYCNFSNIEVVETIIDEGVSGSVPLFERPNGKLITKLIIKKTINHVVSMKLDRMFRSIVDSHKTIEAFNKKNIGLSIVEMGGGSVDTSSSHGKLILQTLSVAAEFERNRISERTKDALKQMKDDGKAYTGNPPFGLINHEGYMVKDPEKFKTVKAVFRMSERGDTYQEIADTLGLSGKTQVYRILKNTVYNRYL